MAINTNLFSRGLKQLLILLLLCIISPVSLIIAFKAINKFSSEEIWLAYLILTGAIIITILTLVLAFYTFKILLDALFNK